MKNVENWTMAAVISFAMSIVSMILAVIMSSPEGIDFMLSAFLLFFGVTIACLFVASEILEG